MKISLKKVFFFLWITALVMIAFSASA